MKCNDKRGWHWTNEGLEKNSHASRFDSSFIFLMRINLVMMCNRDICIYFNKETTRKKGALLTCIRQDSLFLAAMRLGQTRQRIETG